MSFWIGSGGSGISIFLICSVLKFGIALQTDWFKFS